MITLAAKFASIALAAGATAAGAGPVTVAVADIDYATAEGRSTFEARAERAARDFCIRAPAAGNRIAISRSCSEAVKAELNQTMRAIHQARLARGAALAGR